MENHELIEQLYKALYPKLVWYVQQKINSRERAEEIAQDAFTRALTSMEVTNADQAYKWFWVTTQNLVKNEYRYAGASHRSADSMSDIAQTLSQHPPSPEGQVIARETLAQSEGLLSAEDWKLLIKKAEGSSAEEIATEFGMNPPQVDMRAARARQKLR